MCVPALTDVDADDVQATGHVRAAVRGQPGEPRELADGDVDEAADALLAAAVDVTGDDRRRGDREDGLLAVGRPLHEHRNDLVADLEGLELPDPATDLRAGLLAEAHVD